MPTAIYVLDPAKGSGRSSAWPKQRRAVKAREKRRVRRRKKKPRTKPTRLSKRATYPRWWKQIKAAGINFSTAGIHTIIPGEPGTRHFISLITFTVGGETNIVLYNGPFAFTGPMDFGGVDEPRGIVIPLGDSPIMLSPSSGFSIGSTLAVQVSGFIAYISEIVEPPPEK